ncbi:hypothetical protein [Pseudooceanicola sp. LIPI14-2-Ac024]|uniref:hypothetical protein n=1 Tax=Pseudooceanicola sp. LIPI14-2-Ac024 TaxID=3344875 RepID=UPI0035D0A110
MEIVPSTLLALVCVLGLLIQGPYRGLWIFFAVTPLGAAAAFNLPALGGASILIPDIAALTMLGLVAIHRGGPAMIAGTMRYGQPGFWLMLLAVYAVFSALFLPRVFAGQTEVFSLARKANEVGIVEVPLRASSGNITQLFRLMLGVATYLAVATVFRLRPDAAMVLKAVAIATGINVALGVLDVLSYEAGVATILDPIRSANYAILYDVRMIGVKRMIGGYPEASSFGFYTLGLFGFWLQYWFGTPKSRLALTMLLLTTIALLHSTSSAAYVALVIFLVLLAGVGLTSNLRHRLHRRGTLIAVGGLLVALLAALALFAGYELVSPARQFFDRALLDKLQGASGVERMSWNAQAFENFRDTLGFGAGLGSIRASSWLMATLASLGILGTLCALMFIGSVLAGREGRRGADQRAVVIRALRAACLALVLSAVLTGATPDLGVTFFAFAGLAAGLARGAILQRRKTPAARSRRIGQSPNNPPAAPALSPDGDRNGPDYGSNLAKS